MNAPSSSYYYWDVDLDSMIRKLSDLKDVADAQQLKHFMEERKRRLQCIRKVCNITENSPFDHLRVVEFVFVAQMVWKNAARSCSGKNGD